MQTTFKIFFSCLFCLSLALVSGCGNSVSPTQTSTPKLPKPPTLSPVEQAEVDKIIAEHGRAAIVRYLEAVQEDKNRDEKLILKYIQYFASQGADVNAKDGKSRTPLDVVIEVLDGTIEGGEMIALTKIAVEATQLYPLPAGIDATKKLMVPVPMWNENEGNGRQEAMTATARTVDLGKLLGEQPLTMESISAIKGQMVQDGVTVSKTSVCSDDTMRAFEPFVTSVMYTKDDLRSLGMAIAGREDFSVSRSAWLSAHPQSKTPLDLTKEGEKTAIVKFLKSVGGKSGEEL